MKASENPTPTRDEEIALCRELRRLTRQRTDFHREEKALTLRLKSICRRECNCSKDDGNALLERIEAGDVGVDPDLSRHVERLLEARSLLQDYREGYSETGTNGKRHRVPGIEDRIKKTARQLAVWPWIRDEVMGCGDLGLGLLVGEMVSTTADTPGDYRSPAALWKRMGVGLVNGERQRKVIDAEDAKIHGYSPPRRSALWAIGECFVKCRESRYRAVYDERKEYLRQRGWCGKCRRKGETAERDVCIDAHLHNSAKRYAEKRFIKELWQQWRANMIADTRTTTPTTAATVIPMAAV